MGHNRVNKLLCSSLTTFIRSPGDAYELRSGTMRINKPALILQKKT